MTKKREINIHPSWYEPISPTPEARLAETIRKVRAGEMYVMAYGKQLHGEEAVEMARKIAAISRVD